MRFIKAVIAFLENEEKLRFSHANLFKSGRAEIYVYYHYNSL